MTHKERMAAALERRIPDRVPTMELEFQLTRELNGGDWLRQKELAQASPRERERLIEESAAYHLRTYGALEHDAFGVHHLDEAGLADTVRAIRRLSGDEYMIFVHGDGTFAIPDGDGMVDFAYRMADEPEALDKEAESMCREAIERNHRMVEAGVDCFILCSDYCFNKGPFLSPRAFRRFVTPYLTRIIAAIRADGAYAIKHTDGDIMPIIDQLAEANPHALHSLDPMAGVDIARVKAEYGSRLALIGNVNCALMQTGTEAEVRASAAYCMEHGKPGGGYVFATSNVPFTGLPLERYILALEVWRENRAY